MTFSVPSFLAAFTNELMPPTSAAEVAVAASLPPPPELLSFAGGAQAATAPSASTAAKDAPMARFRFTAPPSRRSPSWANGTRDPTLAETEPPDTAARRCAIGDLSSTWRGHHEDWQNTRNGALALLMNGWRM